MSVVRLFKVTGPTGEAIHGGSLTWSLPQGDEPGDWHHVDGPIQACSNGLHLTATPLHFYAPGARVFEAEWRGVIDGSRESDSASKVAVSDARLLREVEWGEFCVWFEGEHDVGEGYALAYGSATVTAYGSATVRASGSATVTASDSATVRAYESATVTAYGSATVTAYGSATVTAYGSATVRASGSATVTASDSATVISTPWHSTSATVALADEAAHVDRRSSKLELRRAA